MVVVTDAKGSTDTSTVDTEPPFGGVPLFVVVNKKTASAAEVLAAALKDNGRATVVGRFSCILSSTWWGTCHFAALNTARCGALGELTARKVGERTFGKGIVQNVVALRRGTAGVSVTVANYATPSGGSINKVRGACLEGCRCCRLTGLQSCAVGPRCFRAGLFRRSFLVLNKRRAWGLDEEIPLTLASAGSLGCRSASPLMCRWSARHSPCSMIAY